MVNYVCMRCGYETDRKYRLVNHINKNKICVAHKIDIPIELLRETIDEPDYNVLLTILKQNYPVEYIKMQDILQNSKRGTKGVISYTDYIPNCSTNNFTKHTEPIVANLAKNKPKKTEKLDCKYCSLVFGSYSARIRHEKHRCIDKPLNDVDSNELIATLLNDKTLLTELNNKLNELSNKKVDSKELVVNNIAPAEQVVNTIGDHNNLYNTKNITNNTINNSNYTINIHQNVFGQENFDYIKNDKKIEAHLEKLADTNTRRFFIELFRLAFFSPKHPENKTFNIDNAKSLYIKILKELPDKWVYASKSETFYKKITQILSWITDETTIVTEGTSTEKKIEQVFMEQQPTISEIKKEFEMMEVLHYKNKKLEEERNIAKLLNKSIE